MRILLVLMSVAALVIAGCVTVNGDVQKFTTTCSGSGCKCASQEEFCRQKGLAASPVKTGAIEDISFTKQTVTCYYYCVTQEYLDKKAEARRKIISCSQEKDNDFYFTDGFSKTQPNIDIRLAYGKDKNLAFASITGSGDFAGQAEIVDGSYYAGSASSIKVSYSGIKNTKAGQNISNGIITFNYTKDGIPKSFSSICKSNA